MGSETPALGQLWGLHLWVQIQGRSSSSARNSSTCGEWVVRTPPE